MERRPHSSSATRARRPARPRPADLVSGRSQQGLSDPRKRLAVVVAVLLLAVLGLGARLVELQVRQGPELAAAAFSQQVQQVTISANRGLILDDKGQVLAGNVPTYDVFAAPNEIPAAARIRYATLLASALHLPASQIVQVLAKRLDFVYLAKDQSVAVENKLKTLNLQGIGSIQGETRSYGPGGVAGTSLASNVLGFVNASAQGQYGLEGYYNSQLSGHSGKESVIQDLAGNPVQLSSDPSAPAANGRNLETSLDASTQVTVEKDLAAEIKKVNATSGTTIVMNVHTGAIVAWADEPTYNANEYATEPDSLFKDQGVADLYEPGSLEKVITFAGALNRHVITPTTKVFDPGYVTVQGATIHDWDLSYQGVITTSWVLDDSLNVGAVKIEQMEGGTPFYNNMKAFGIGSPTGIDLAGSSNQALAPLSSLQPVQLATDAFGQGFVTTPIQMLAAVNTVANGGVWVEPHVVTAIAGGGKPTTYIKSTTRRVITAATAKTLTQMMVGVVDVPGASGFEAKMGGSWLGEIAGKTGTASVAAVNGSYSQNDTIDSFTEFFPASDPEYSMLTIIRDPHVPAAQQEGAYNAAPVSKLITEQMIDRFKLQP